MADEDRRTLLKIGTCVAGGGAALALAGPVASVLVGPSMSKTVTGTGEFLPVMELAALPPDGSVLGVDIVARAPRDAWSKLPPTRIGAAYLSRNGDAVQAFSTVCPHLGCQIEYARGKERFVCPCHDSAFLPDGSVESGPSPRAMDELETRVVDGKVEIKFQRFKTGAAEKIVA